MSLLPQSGATKFSVRRNKPELVSPAKATPYEFKQLSDIDDQEGLRFHIQTMLLYRQQPSSIKRKEDPVKIIREALAKTLVFYYPFAGRLREGPYRKLVVECTGEGALFIEADADFSLEQFSETLLPPFPYHQDLLYDVPESSGIINCPLLLIQVTRLKCGGLIFAIRTNHTLCDASGLGQFMRAMLEMTQGATTPSIKPVWQRELLTARVPPRVTCSHRAYDQIIDNNTLIDRMVRRSIFFTFNEISSIRRLISLELQHNCTNFELLTAFLWRHRTIALQLDSNEEVRLLCIVNSRKIFNPPLPKGYYGNAHTYSVALTTAGELCRNSLEYAIKLVKKAKSDVTEEHMRSLADLMVISGRPNFTMARSYLVSDLTRSGFGEIDFGWGKPVFAGPSNPRVSSFYVAFRNKKGEDGIALTISLPALAMKRFAKEMDARFSSAYTNSAL